MGASLVAAVLIRESRSFSKLPDLVRTNSKGEEIIMHPMGVPVQPPQHILDMMNELDREIELQELRKKQGGKLNAMQGEATSTVGSSVENTREEDESNLLDGKEREQEQQHLKFMEEVEQMEIRLGSVLVCFNVNDLFIGRFLARIQGNQQQSFEYAAAMDSQNQAIIVVSTLMGMLVASVLHLMDWNLVVSV
jgi:hypothetical protein